MVKPQAQGTVLGQ